MEARDQTYHHVRLDAVRTWSGYRFERCAFHHCTVSGVAEDGLIGFEDVALTSCTASSVHVQRAWFRDVVVADVRTGALQHLWSCLFHRVTLRGRFDRLVVRPRHGDAAIAALAATFYRDVDWAIDISAGAFRELSIHGVPARLIRRDAATQAVVRREAVAGTAWDTIATGVSRVVIREMLDSDDDDCVIVAPRRHRRNFAAVMEQIAALREAAIAEPS